MTYERLPTPIYATLSNSLLFKNDSYVNVFSVLTIAVMLVHRRSQRVQWVHLHPYGGEKNLGVIYRGKFVSVPPAHQVHPQAESIFRTFFAARGRFGASISSFRPFFEGDA